MTTYRERAAKLERPLLLAGLALIALHLLDLAVSGPDTTPAGVLGIIAVPVAWVLAQPRVTRPTRLVLGVLVGLLAFGFGVISHGLHVVNSGPNWTDVTGVAMIAGGLLLVGAGLAAIAAPRRSPRRPAFGWRLAHGAGWLAAVPVFAPVRRAAVHDGSEGHRTRRARRPRSPRSASRTRRSRSRRPTDGRQLTAWYVPSRNRTAGAAQPRLRRQSRACLAHVRMLARHGYGVLALDNPGNGESDGHSNGLGYNAQPAIDAALEVARPAARRRSAAHRRLRLLTRGRGAAGDRGRRPPAARGRRRRIHAADGRPSGQRPGARRARVRRGLARGGPPSVQAATRGAVAGGCHPRIAPRPVLLIAGGSRRPGDDPANRKYREGPAVLSRTSGAPQGRPHRRAPHLPRRLRTRADHRVPRPGPRAQGDLMTILRHVIC